MSRRPIAFAADLPDLVLAELASVGDGLGWVIDIDRGSILAANPRGAEEFGLARGQQSLLDAAMPALVSLRALADSAAPEPRTPLPLVFWAGGRATRYLCDVRLLLLPAHRIAVVSARQPSPPLPTEADTSSASRHFAGDDAATLKEIARRIREGHLSAPQVVAAGKAGGPACLDAPYDTHARLAHELRTPLGAIAAAAEIMKEQRLGPIGSARYLGYAGDIQGSAEHALAVVERLLSAARDGAATGDGPALAFAELDAASLLRSVVSQLGPLAERAGITLTLDVAPRLPHLIADATSLRQVVINLVTNALKFTDRGGQVALTARHEAEGTVRIAVSDTGPGMTQRSQPRGAGPLQLRSSQKPEFNGSGLGLGLPLVQTLARANGADFAIESDPGQGTSATVVFRKDRVVPV